MDLLADILATICLAAGLFFFLIGAIGIVRFPDAYNRMHASSKCSTLGLLGLLLGAVFHLGTLAVTTKALLTIIFAFVATPVGSHILARAAHMNGLKQWGRTLSDELAIDRPERPRGCPASEADPRDDDQRPPFADGGSDDQSSDHREPTTRRGVSFRFADDAAA